ncbi:N-acetylmuramoyl-L-alanine amidase [Acinetobacter sp. WZC-1]|uniref:N-acetylmuramoyl-L-alanine amidase n=1 Tax=Acinetobacter sp. WZC-1 TaxID=3459034 RepID=UPI00403E06E1
MKSKLTRIFIISCLSFFLIACNNDDKKEENSKPVTSSSTLSSNAPEYMISDHYQVDTQYLSPNQDDRQMMLILHYTALPLDETLRIFMNDQYAVSSHYLIPQKAVGAEFTVYNLVPDDKRAWHAGASYWQGNRSLNASSIGIELENPGFPAEDENLPLMQRRWYPYDSKQQLEVLAEVIQRIVLKYKITPTRIIGHSDISPGRKFDPGPLLPWKQLYTDYNIGAWYDDEAVNYYRLYAPWEGDVTDLQTKLALYGYDVPNNGIYDQATEFAVSAFQMHFYPEKYDGQADIETVARLDALLEKYRGQKRPDA